ncbi:MAG: hypothetical protein PHT02_00645 [Tissierellia bacterium]|nr:hypothetical protein [Tissierellia bacterium]
MNKEHNLALIKIAIEKFTKRKIYELRILDTKIQNNENNGELFIAINNRVDSFSGYVFHVCYDSDIFKQDYCYALNEPFDGYLFSNGEYINVIDSIIENKNKLFNDISKKMKGANS